MGFYPNRKEVVLLLQLLFVLVDTKLCVIKQQPDATEHFHMRWVLPYIREILCTCTKVEYQTCNGGYHISMPLAKDYFYTDDPTPFVASESPDNLRVLLKCAENTAVWSVWGAWESCSSSCGDGTQSRVKECVNTDIPDAACDGEQPRESKPCNDGECPVWSEWSTWESYSVSCGDGTQRRVKECVKTDFPDAACDGEQSRESKPCNDGECRTCPPEWTTNGTCCYYVNVSSITYNQASITYNQARDACKSHGANLTSVTNEEEQTFLFELMRHLNVWALWIGLNDKTTEGNWEWEDGTQYGDYDNWADYQPDNVDGEDCVMVMPERNYQWNDINCGQQMSGYICKIS